MSKLCHYKEARFISSFEYENCVIDIMYLCSYPLETYLTCIFANLHCYFYRLFEADILRKSYLIIQHFLLRIQNI